MCSTAHHIGSNSNRMPAGILELLRYNTATLLLYYTTTLLTLLLSRPCPRPLVCSARDCGPRGPTAERRREQKVGRRGGGTAGGLAGGQRGPMGQGHHAGRNPFWASLVAVLARNDLPRVELFDLFSDSTRGSTVNKRRELLNYTSQCRRDNPRVGRALRCRFWGRLVEERRC